MSINRITLVVLLCLLAGCSQISYYAQATRGQLEIVAKRKKITDILRHTDEQSTLSISLRLASDIRNFASEKLGLPDNDTFRYYSDLNRRYVVWNVVATPQYSLAPKTWCFPVAGCVAYKGYFSQRDAERLNQSLIDRGYDTFLYGVSAYSTLGRFSDPILNTFLRFDEFSLAGLIFHELAHQVVYVKDDSEFNEAFATAVEIEGLRRWILERHSTETFAAYQENRERNTKITEMVLDFRDQLIKLYRSEPGDLDLEREKMKIFQAMRDRYDKKKQQGESTRYYDWWFNLALNNAHLASIATYHRLVPAFSRLIAQSDSLSDFYAEVKMLSKMNKSERERLFADLMPYANAYRAAY